MTRAIGKQLRLEQLSLEGFYLVRVQHAHLVHVLAVDGARVVLDRVDAVVQLSLELEALADLVLVADEEVQVLLAGLLARRLSPRQLVLPRHHLDLAVALPLLVAHLDPACPVSSPPAAHLHVPPAAWRAATAGPRGGTAAPWRLARRRSACASALIGISNGSGLHNCAHCPDVVCPTLVHRARGLPYVKE